ncbi:FMRFamide receptor [Araneus ventricosus]|uniref:FMRFamide receptor n=1 Tax=Araneus ventricosus TaxID=182803 RepID=A0A4Y2IX77_ARAVE|nr:FMRFamide receptor [Araneus ventricosus]
MNTSESNFTVDEADDIEFHKNFMLTARFWVQRILVPSIMTIGIVGNVITIVIMTRRRMRSSTNNYLAALAIFDMMYLIFTFILSLSHYSRVPDSDHYVYWRLKPFILMLTDTCSNTSVWLTVTFTVERYIAVCHPMKGKVFCTESRAKKAIVAVFLFCFAFTIPTPFEWKVIERVDQATNHTTLALDHSEMGKNYLYKTIYYWLTVVFFIFVPFILLAIFNSFLIRSVHLSKVQRSSMTRGENSDSSQENKITIMLIAVVILFFVCQLPTACHLLYSTLHENFDLKQLYLLRGLGNIFNFLMSLNAAGNFVLYCLLSQKYRRTFIQIFCPCLREKRGMMNSMYYQSTVCSNVDTDSPGSSSSRRLSNARISKLSTPRGSSGDVNNTRRDSPAGGSRTVFLQVPRCSASKVVYDDADEDTFTEDSGQGQTSCAGRCRKMIRGPWKHLKQSMGIEDKKTREQIIPLKGGGNKCIVITAPEGMPDSTSHWTPNSAV